VGGEEVGFKVRGAWSRAPAYSDMKARVEHGFFGSPEKIMCIVCEHELWDEHRALEREFFKPCKTCNKFPGASSEGTCYHCFAVGNTIDECPECAGKPWSEEFLAAKDEIEGPDKLLVPF